MRRTSDSQNEHPLSETRIVLKCGCDLQVNITMEIMKEPVIDFDRYNVICPTHRIGINKNAD